MTGRGLLDWRHGLTLTGEGIAWPAEFGIALSPTTRRPPVRSCPDWTESRSHLAGAAVCRHALDSGWITRIGTTRAVPLTDVGRRALRDHLGLAGEILDPAG